ncbi:tyrosine protein phosphatase [Dactylosporangium sp. NPDC048998]|uniref:phosphatase domain-containing putative toxin n=1 Tax=Dactylosporangium sp. NPDC048998 TaxID=3363976 RepID=UPI00371D9B0F
MLYTVPSPGPGRVSVMAKPRAGDWLGDDLARLAAAGVGVLVSLLTPAEVAETGLDGEPAAARAAGLRFLHAPVPDRSVPDARFSAAVLPVLDACYGAGQHLVVHCRFGIGRSAAVAAAVLVRAGGDPARVWADIAAVRGVPVPDVDAQRRWVEKFVT